MASDDLPDEDVDLDMDDVPRDAPEISRRALILSAVVACAFGEDKPKTVDWLKTQGLWSDVSPQEQDFLSGYHTPQQRIDMTWRAEALVPLLWVLRKIDPMPALSEQFDLERAAKAVIFPPAPVAAFVASAALRRPEEIDEEHERVYEAHWRVRDARFFGKPAPADINASVVQERHYAFNWIVGYCNQTWDEISTDT